jgi:ketosteroid isomerase-like protein
MPQENVNRMRESIEAMNRRDIQAVLRSMDPEVRFEHRLAALQGNFVGLDGVRGWLADLAEHFDAWRIHCPDIRDLGDDRVLALGTVKAKGRESGVETELPFTVVATFRDGLITHFTDFGDKNQALKAAGVRK